MQAQQDIKALSVPGQIPANAVIQSGNWWATEVSSYSTKDECWNVSFALPFFSSHRSADIH